MSQPDQSSRSAAGPGRNDGAQLTTIGLAGGAFSGLFGVGGGTVMVPLLTIWRGFNEKKATGTSLFAIIIVATYAVIGHGIFGSVDVQKGIFIGIPAIAGVVFGTALQQRLSDRMLSGMFAVLMIVIAIMYLVT